MVSFNPTYTPDRGRNGTLTLDVSDTSGSNYPISLTDVKQWLKVDTDADDDVIIDLMTEVFSHVENTYKIPIISKDVVATWDSYSKQVRLPFTPVSSITSVKTVDSEGTEETLTANDNYRLVGNTLYFQSISPYRNPFDRVSLVVTYVSAWSTVPNDVLLGLKQCILTNYEDRQDNAGMTLVEIPSGSKQKFNKYVNFDN